MIIINSGVNNKNENVTLCFFSRVCVKNVCFSSSVKGCCEQNVVNVDYMDSVSGSLATYFFKKKRKGCIFCVR